jgi:hypothetical protein
VAFHQLPEAFLAALVQRAGEDDASFVVEGIQGLVELVGPDPIGAVEPSSQIFGQLTIRHGTSDMLRAPSNLLGARGRVNDCRSRAGQGT